MTKAKPATTNDNPENPVQVLKEATCSTSNGKSTLGYQVGVDETGDIYLRIVSNDGGGFFSDEWVDFNDIQAALSDWPKDQGVTSMALRKIFRAKSANQPGFTLRILVAEHILEPVADKMRVHQICDPSRFLGSVEELRKKAGISATKKPATKAKAKTPARSKAKTKAAAKAKTPRKTR